MIVDSRLPPLADRLLTAIGELLPMQRAALARSANDLQPEEVAEFERYLAYCHAKGVTIEQLVSAYRVICDDTLREQVYFRRHGRYRHSSFDEVASNVYFDSAYMASYMHGLAITLYLWPNHLEIARFFGAVLPAAPTGNYLEIGPGHGAFFIKALRSGKFSSLVGIDISPTSLAITRGLLESAGAARGAWELHESDFLTFDPGGRRFDAIVMGEVLEHVEDPGRFLSRIREMSNPNTFIFVTTAVNAPAVDHIYLFRSVAEVHALAEGAGLRVLHSLSPPYQGCTMTQTLEQRLPINVALVLAP